MSGPHDPEWVAAALRRAAEEFEPDRERILDLIDQRSDGSLRERRSGSWASGPTDTGEATQAQAASPMPGGTGRLTSGGWTVTGRVTPVTTGKAYSVPTQSGESWMIASTGPSGRPLQVSVSNRQVGPVQVMGQGGRVDPGPFSLAWTGEGSVGSGTTTSWLT